MEWRKVSICKVSLRIAIEEFAAPYVEMLPSARLDRFGTYLFCAVCQLAYLQTGHVQDLISSWAACQSFD
jgi:hypothetical protein